MTLPIKHLSARVPWHDNKWNGTYCCDVLNNSFCRILPRIDDTKDVDTEPDGEKIKTDNKSKEVDMNLEKYNPNTNFLLYKTATGDVKVDVLLQDKTIWLPQKKILQEYIIKGYSMDVERLKNLQPLFCEDYFKEQLEKIRDIRSSERRL